MNKVVAPQAINALIDALACIYWFKTPLNRFITSSISGVDLLQVVKISFDDSSLNKREIVERIFNYILQDKVRHTPDVLALLENVSDFADYSHFYQRKIENPEEKIRTAKRAVAAVRECVKPYIEDIQRVKEVKRNREQTRKEAEGRAAFAATLNELNDRFSKLVCSNAKQTRGYELEKIIFQLFRLFNLDPTPSFRTKFDQVDGAFTLDGTEYLLEAKWTDSQISTVDLDAFDRQIDSRTLENTLGVFISVNGFAANAIEAYSNRRHRLLLVAGEDLIKVLRGEISLPVLLQEKKKQASRFSKAG